MMNKGSAVFGGTINYFGTPKTFDWYFVKVDSVGVYL